MNGTHDEIPPTSFPSFVDVRDLADAHVKALTAPGARDKRLLVDGKGMTYTGLVRALGKVGELEGRLPRESGEDKKVVMARIEAEGDNAVLGMRFRTLEETMRDTAGRLLELERAFGVASA
jgi:nucleoside-diphosphate-sugar epimerase